VKTNGRLLLLALCLGGSLRLGANAFADRAKVPGQLVLHARARQEVAPGKVEVVMKDLAWNTAETAIIVCDMWDHHWCLGAERRVGILAPKLNAALETARSNGMLVVHAPSETMDFYKDTIGRKRAREAPAATPPVPIERSCRLDPSVEGALPIDDSDGGCDCDPPCPDVHKRKWTRQHPAIDIATKDVISDDGAEIFNVFRQQGIKNVIIMGVHTNMCVLGRSFAIRQMTRLGFNVVLVRDLTDSMYNPRRSPNVSHARGTELVVEHIERFWCPSILSADLANIAPGSAGP
jgi:nicotinamidase-related amidase